MRGEARASILLVCTPSQTDAIAARASEQAEPQAGTRTAHVRRRPIDGMRVSRWPGGTWRNTAHGGVSAAS